VPYQRGNQSSKPVTWNAELVAIGLLSLSGERAPAEL